EELYTDALTLIILAGVFWWQVLSELTQPPTKGRDKDPAPRPGASFRDGPAMAAASEQAGAGAGAAQPEPPSERMRAISFQAGSEELDADEFREGACTAYEQIVTAFANGNLALLVQHLSPDVYEAF